MIPIICQERHNGKYKYIAFWNLDGIPLYQWFTCRKDLNEYFANWIGYKLEWIAPNTED